MEIEKNKFFAKKSIVRSIVLLVICTPLLLGAFLKFFYYLPKDSNALTNGFINATKDLVSKLYHGFEPVQWVWPWSPTPSVEMIVSFGNIAALLLFLGFLWGLASFQLGFGVIDELSEAKRNARKKRLEDEYKDRDEE